MIKKLIGLSFEEIMTSLIKRDISKGITKEQIIDEWKEFDEDENNEFSRKKLKFVQDYFNPKSKSKSVKKMAKETSEFQRKIINENEEWNKGRKEIKYLTVKPKRERLLNLTVYMVTDKTGRHMKINTEILSDQLTTKMRRNILNVLSTDMKKTIASKKSII
jgi:hypothetical protein